MRKWEHLPQELQKEEIKPYYKALKSKGFSLLLKRVFDIFASAFLIVLLSPVMLVLAILIKFDSSGPVFYKSTRVTRYNKDFTILKFRTMTADADKKGSLITVSGDNRITKIGAKIRGSRLDEIPQLFNVLMGDMSFVGTRPEVRRYVDMYTSEMLATLLLPAGITSKASLAFKNEDEKMSALTKAGLSVDEAYVNHILPEKMKINVEYINNFSFLEDISTCIKTVF